MNRITKFSLTLAAVAFLLAGTAQADDWPQADPNVERISAREEFSRARMEVDQYVREHGGFFVPAE